MKKEQARNNNASCSVDLNFKMPSLDDLIDYYSRYHEEWYNDTIEMIIDEEGINDDDHDDAEELARKIAKDKGFGETYNYLKETLEDIKRGKSIFRLLGIRNKKEFLEKIKRGDIKDLGEHWTESLSIASNLVLTSPDEKKIFLEATTDIKCVDIEETFSLREMYPDEWEINLNEGCEIFLKGIIYEGGKFTPINRNFRV